MYRSELVPRRMAMLGLIGGPWSARRDRHLFGAFDAAPEWQGIATIPEFLWERLATQ
jgi:hypothetical protein